MIAVEEYRGKVLKVTAQSTWPSVVNLLTAPSCEPIMKETHACGDGLKGTGELKIDYAKGYDLSVMEASVTSSGRGSFTCLVAIFHSSSPLEESE